MDIQWSLVLFTAIASCGTWVSVGVAVDELRGLTQRTNLVASVLALVLAVVGGIASVTHLSHPDRIMAVLSHPTAGIFLEALLIGLFIAAVAVYVILLKRDASAGARKAVAVLAAVIGIVFSFASGYSYMMEARTTWNTITLPLGYLGFGAASGLSLYLLLVACKKESAEAVKLAGLETVIGGVLALDSLGISLNDGQSELLLVRDIKNLIDFNNVSTALLKSDFRENENIVSKKVRRVHFTFDTPVDWSLDGEYGGTVTDVEIVNHQRAVNIIVPR